jgi:low affinity Fe/Cu permease
MDYQVLFNLSVAIAAFFGGWVLNNITKTLERLDNDVRKMPHDYVGKEDYHRDIDEIKDICKQIFAKLDNKADKS